MTPSEPTDPLAYVRDRAGPGRRRVHRRAVGSRSRAAGDAGHPGPGAPDGRGAVRGVAGAISCTVVGER